MAKTVALRAGNFSGAVKKLEMLNKKIEGIEAIVQTLTDAGAATEDKKAARALNGQAKKLVTLQNQLNGISEFLEGKLVAEDEGDAPAKPARSRGKKAEAPAKPARGGRGKKAEAPAKPARSRGKKAEAPAKPARGKKAPAKAPAKPKAKAPAKGKKAPAKPAAKPAKGKKAAKAKPAKTKKAAKGGDEEFDFDN